MIAEISENRITGHLSVEFVDDDNGPNVQATPEAITVLVDRINRLERTTRQLREELDLVRRTRGVLHG